MSTEITYDYSANVDLQFLINELENPLPLVRAIAAYQKGQFRNNIALGLDAYGDRFTPLNSDYARSKIKAVGRRAILSYSGNMLSTYFQDISKNGVRAGFKSPIAGYHQKGSDRLPQRLLLPTEDRGLPTRDQEIYTNLTIKYLEQASSSSRR